MIFLCKSTTTETNLSRSVQPSDLVGAAGITEIFAQFNWAKFGRFNTTCRLIGQRRLLRGKFESQSVVDYVVGILNELGYKAEVQALLKFDDQLRTIMKQNEIEYTEVSLPAALKQVELKLPVLTGVYTLFNKFSTIPTLDKKIVYDTLHKDRITKWLLTPKPHDGFPMNRFKSELRNILSSATLPNKKGFSFRTFIRERALWQTKGGIELKEYVNPGLTRNKTGFAWSNTDNELINIFDTEMTKTPISHLVEKSEPGAVRLVVLADWPTYMMMSYYSYWLDEALSTVNGLYNYRRSDDKLDFWISRVLRCGLNKWQALLDYEGWDESVFTELIMAVIDELEFIMSGVKGVDNLFGLLKDRIKHCKLDLEAYDLGIVDILNGVQSGWRWTTLINSVVNKVLNRMCGVDAETLGDDVDAPVDDEEGGNRLIDDLTDLGFKVSKTKTKILQGAGEFLKQAYDKNGVYGDPIRAIRALMWGDSEAERAADHDPVTILNTRVDIWVKYLSRSRRTKEELKDLIVSDLNGAVRTISRENVRKLLLTPRTEGGLGLFATLDTTSWIKMVVGKKTKSDAGNINHSIKPDFKANLFTYWYKGLKSLFLTSVKVVSLAFRKYVSGYFDIQSPLIYVPAAYAKWKSYEMPLVQPVEGKHALTDWKLLVDGGGVEEYMKTNNNTISSNLQVYRRKLSKKMFELWSGGKLVINTPMDYIMRYGETVGPLYSKILANSLVGYAVRKGMGSELFSKTSMWFENVSSSVVSTPYLFPNLT